MSAVDHLRRIPLFSDLTADEMVDVLRMATLVQFAPEQRICQQGTVADCLFILEEGQGVVRVQDAQGRSREVSRIGAGEVLGELGLVDGQTRSADVVALTAVRAYRIDRAQFDRMRAAMHPAAFKMLRRIALTVSARLRAINAAISEQIAPNEEPRGSRTPEPPVGRVSRVNTAPVATARVSRVNTAPVASGRGSRVHPAPAPVASAPHPPAAREPEERSLLRSVLARFSGGSK